MKKKKERLSLLEIIFFIFIFTFFTVFVIVCIYPFYYLIINTISANHLSEGGDIILYPRGIHFKNYVAVFKIPGLLNAAYVSVARTVIGTALTVLGSAYLGFMFTQEKMWLRKVWYRLIVFTMYFSAGLIPWYLTMMNLHLTNNFLAYVIPGIVTPFFIILSKTYIESTPKALQEAAEIDGAGVLQVFWIIVMPLAKPILATIAIFAAVGQWNSFQDALILMTDQKLHPLQYILYTYINQANSLAALVRSGEGISSDVIDLARRQTATSVRMTVSVIVVFPILLVYPFFQRFFVQGIMIGSVKG